MHNLGLNLSATIDKFVEPARKVSNLTQEASEKLNTFQKELSSIDNQKKAISRVNQLKTSIDSNNKSLVQARRSVDRLAAQRQAIGL